MKTRTGNLFKRNGTYYARWRVNGKLFMRSTGETQLKAAKDALLGLLVEYGNRHRA